MKMPLPRWLESMPDGSKKDKAINRFYLQLASLYASPEGTMKKLAEILGITHQSIKAQAICNDTRGATTETREGISRLIGPEFAPPELPERRW